MVNEDRHSTYAQSKPNNVPELIEQEMIILSENIAAQRKLACHIFSFSFDNHKKCKAFMLHKEH